MKALGEEMAKVSPQTSTLTRYSACSSVAWVVWEEWEAWEIWEVWVECLEQEDKREVVEGLAKQVVLKIWALETLEVLTRTTYSKCLLLKEMVVELQVSLASRGWARAKTEPLPLNLEDPNDNISLLTINVLVLIVFMNY